MAKDAYYFSHDSNAHQDPKITKLLLSMGAKGYGIYWIIIEMLRSEDSLSLSKDMYDAMAYHSHSDSIDVASVVENFGLFEFDEHGHFYSESLNRRVANFRAKSAKYSENAKKRWSKDAIAMPSDCHGNALKKRKEKKSKENTYSDECAVVIEYLNKKAYRNYKPLESSIKPIRARLSEGFTIEDCKKVIDIKTEEWLNDSSMAKYLRPSTLFQSEKFQGYLNQIQTKKAVRKEIQPIGVYIP